MRHLGTDINYIVLENLYAHLKDKVDFFFDTPVNSVTILENGYAVNCAEKAFPAKNVSFPLDAATMKWMERICNELKSRKINRVDPVRVELPAEVFLIDR